MFHVKIIFLTYNYLHTLPKFTSKAPSIQMENGQHCTILFMIPLAIIVHRLHFEIFTLVSEIQGHVDLVFGIKTLFEIEADLNVKKFYITDLNRFVPMCKGTDVKVLNG